jgi:ribosomal protein S18 acetylase RimI-like enzyme
MNQIKEKNAFNTNSDGFKMQKANKRKHLDIATFAKLIYNADECLYKDLFGDEKSALKILEKCSEDENSLFYKGNFYIASIKDKVDGMVINKIVGLAGVFLPHVKWNEKLHEELILQSGCNLPETFQYVSREYFDKFFNDNSPKIKIGNVCVLEEFRKHGFGNKMIASITKTYKNSVCKLGVLTDNAVAIHVYKNNGFKITDKYKDYFGVNITHEKKGNGELEKNAEVIWAESYAMEFDGHIKNLLTKLSKVKKVVNSFKQEKLIGKTNKTDNVSL